MMCRSLEHMIVSFVPTNVRDMKLNAQGNDGCLTDRLGSVQIRFCGVRWGQKQKITQGHDE